MRLHPLHPPIRHLIRRMPPALLQPAPTDPDDDGHLLRHRLARRPHVQKQTVLALGLLVLELRDELPEEARVVAALLEAEGRVLAGVAVEAVVPGGQGREETSLAHGGLAVPDATPLVHVRGAVGASVDEARVAPARGVDGQLRVVLLYRAAEEADGQECCGELHIACACACRK
ncbi:hypothetical protein PGQ11_014530 [Apiospora arundinis]|uniref:Uncharacterized protein n=1 Tax=Apiospora arundinis TaxID=335852 RepID=A0ABR2HSI3_9PEZI